MNDTSNVGVNSVPQANPVPATPNVAVPTPAAAPVAQPAPVVSPSPVAQSEPVLTNPMAQTTTVSANVVPPVAPAPVAQPAQVAPTQVAPTQVAPAQTTVQTPAPVAPVVQTPVVPAPAPQQPVAPAAQAPSVVTPAAPTVEAPVAPEPVAAKEESKIEVQLADNIKIDSENKKEKKKKKEKKSSYDEDEENTIKANRYPIILAVVFVSLLLLVFVYYYLVMTPYNVFDSALSSMVDAVKDGVDNFGEDDSERNTFDLKFDLQTDTKQFENNPEQEPIDYINGDHIQGIVNFDTISKGFSVNLLADKAIKNLPEGVTDYKKRENLANMLDLKIYSFNDNMYLGPIYYIDYNDPEEAKKAPINSDKIVQVSFGSESEGRSFSVDSFTLDSLKYAADLIDLIIEKGKTTVFESDLERGIVFKKVGDNTAIALKANCDTDSKMIDRVFHGTFDDEFINRKDVIDLTQKVFGFSEQEAKDFLQEIHDRPQDINHLDINLYMNLANTELISFDMTFDEKYYIELDYLKGFYSIIIRVMTDGKEENDTLNIKASYDRDNGIVDGLGIINNDNTFLAVKFDYNRKITTTGEKVGNSLKFKFYNNDSYKETDESKQKPFCRLDCTLDIYESNDDPGGKTKFDLKEEIKDAHILPVSQYKTSSGLIIKSTLTDLPKISVAEGVQIINFEKGFNSHIMFLVDHLLYNKEGAIARRDADDKEETKVEDKTEEVTDDTSEEVSENTQTTEEINESTQVTENNTSTTENVVDTTPEKE